MTDDELEAESRRVASEVPEIDEAAARDLIMALTEDDFVFECQGMPDGPFAWAPRFVG